VRRRRSQRARHLINGSLRSISSHPNLHLDLFIGFCGAHPSVCPIDKQTTELATRAAVGRINAARPNKRRRLGAGEGRQYFLLLATCSYTTTAASRQAGMRLRGLYTPQNIKGNAHKCHTYLSGTEYSQHFRKRPRHRLLGGVKFQITDRPKADETEQCQN